MGIYKQLILLFGLMVIGFVCYKLDILDDASNKKISRLIVNIALPATVLNSAIGQTMENPLSYLIAFLIGIAFYLIFPVISRVICRFLHYNTTMELMLTYANVGFMGLPIVSAIWGDQYLLYVVVGMMGFNLSLFSYGIYVLKKDQQGSAKMDAKGILKTFLNPCIISAVLALLILVFSIPVPDVIGNIFSSVGSITVPLAMIVIGSTLGNVSFKEMFTDKRLYVFLLLKLLIYPALVFLMLRFLPVDPIIRSIFVLLTSLPTAGNVSMLCAEYDGDMPLVSKGTCMATLFSAATIPLWIFILNNFMR